MANEQSRFNGSQTFESLYSYYYPKMVNHAYSKINDAAAAEDLVQDIFLALYMKNVEADNIKHYLFVSLRNRIYDYWRKQLLHDKHAVFIKSGLSESSENIWNDIVAKEMKEELNKHIQELPSRCKEVFILRREEQLSNKEISERLGISVNTVEQHMRKALHILKIHYGFELIITLVLFTMK